jgi:NAD-dependent dihydropyrimidine dehydrogenase PreA subunit
MKRSTQWFFQEGRKLDDYSLFDFLHGYVYARWPYLYIGIGLGEHPIAKTFMHVRSMVSRRQPTEHTQNKKKGGMADTYHGKVLLPESAHTLVQVQKDIDLRDLEHVIPYPIARDIVLKNPDHIVVLECPCRSVREDPCLPLDVCMIIGEPFASFVLEHHPEKSRPLSREQAVRLLEQERERGHVHHAFFKDAMLGRFYAICNCCSCCCGAIQSVRNGSPMLTSSGYLAHVDESRCIGCASCLEVCNFDALRIENSVITIIDAKCMGCGICVEACLEGALRLEREPTKGVPLEIVKLMDASVATQG